MTGHLPAAGWRTPGRCGPNGGNCVEVNLGSTSPIVGIRDTKPAESPVLIFGAGAWRSFLTATTGGDVQV